MQRSLASHVSGDVSFGTSPKAAHPRKNPVKDTRVAVCATLRVSVIAPSTGGAVRRARWEVAQGVDVESGKSTGRPRAYHVINGTDPTSSCGRCAQNPLGATGACHGVAPTVAELEFFGFRIGSFAYRNDVPCGTVALEPDGSVALDADGTTGGQGQVIP